MGKGKKTDLERALDRHWKKLRKYPNVLNVAVGTKFVGGKDTGQGSITIFVKKKMPKELLSSENIIPTEIDGIPTDVVEINPKTWVAGETGVSRLHPEEQRRRLGVRRG